MLMPSTVIKRRFLAGISYVFCQVYFLFSLCTIACAHIPFIWWDSFPYCTVRVSEVYPRVLHNVFTTEGRAFLTRGDWIKDKSEAWSNVSTENLIKISWFALYYCQFRDRLPTSPSCSWYLSFPLHFKRQGSFLQLRRHIHTHPFSCLQLRV